MDHIIPYLKNPDRKNLPILWESCYKERCYCSLSIWDSYKHPNRTNRDISTLQLPSMPILRTYYLLLHIGISHLYLCEILLLESNLDNHRLIELKS